MFLGCIKRTIYARLDDELQTGTFVFVIRMTPKYCACLTPAGNHVKLHPNLVKRQLTVLSDFTERERALKFTEEQ